MPELLVVSAILVAIMLTAVLPVGVTCIVIGSIFIASSILRIRHAYLVYPPPRWLLHWKVRRMWLTCRWWRLKAFVRGDRR